MELAKRYLIPMLLFLFIASSYKVCLGSEKARSYIDGIKFYHQGDYQKAVSEFHSIAESGVQNGELFYNIGNAYFKNGDIGLSILWYERALKLIPNDPDLKFNYQYAKEMVKDKTEDKASPLFRVLFFWKHIFSKKAIQLSGIILFIVFWLLVVVQIIKGRSVMRIPGGIVLTLAVVLISTSLYDFYDDKYNNYAIIISDKVSVRSALTEDATELFVLHAGTKVKVESELREYFKIVFSGKKIGWLKKEVLEII